jgi:hypothetical protein
VENLDADKLDGYHAIAFPRKAEDATITGSWTFTPNQRFNGNAEFDAATEYVGSDATGSLSLQANVRGNIGIGGSDYIRILDGLVQITGNATPGQGSGLANLISDKGMELYTDTDFNWQTGGSSGGTGAAVVQAYDRNIDGWLGLVHRAAGISWIIQGTRKMTLGTNVLDVLVDVNLPFTETLSFESIGTVGVNATAVNMWFGLPGLFASSRRLYFDDAATNDATSSEYIYCANDGFMDYNATTQHRFSGGITSTGDITADNYYVPDGGSVGISGNELMTFAAAGTVTVNGADLVLAGAGELQFRDSDLAIWSSADSILNIKADGYVEINGILNLEQTSATTGQITQNGGTLVFHTYGGDNLTSASGSLPWETSLPEVRTWRWVQPPWRLQQRLLIVPQLGLRRSGYQQLALDGMSQLVRNLSETLGHPPSAQALVISRWSPCLAAPRTRP